MKQNPTLLIAKQHNIINQQITKQNSENNINTYNPTAQPYKPGVQTQQKNNRVKQEQINLGKNGQRKNNTENK